MYLKIWKKKKKGQPPATQEESLILLEERMAQKYVSLDSTHLFTPVVIETAGVIGPKSLVFLKDLGTRLGQETREETVQAYLLQ